MRDLAPTVSPAAVAVSLTVQLAVLALTVVALAVGTLQETNTLTVVALAVGALQETNQHDLPPQYVRLVLPTWI